MAERTHVDHGLTETNRERPGLREALAACRSGDTLVVTKLDRLARSLPDARQILADLTTRDVKLSLGGSVHDPTDPVGRLLFNALAMVAEFASDLIRLRTREGMKVAKAKGRLQGKQPKLNPHQEAHLLRSTTRASTAPPSSATCSVSPAQPSTARLSATPGEHGSKLANEPRQRAATNSQTRPQSAPNCPVTVSFTRTGRSGCERCFFRALRPEPALARYLACPEGGSQRRLARGVPPLARGRFGDGSA